MKMVRIVIALTPYGVMALMAGVFSAYRFEQFASLLGFIAACYLADSDDVYRPRTDTGSER